MRGRLNIVVGFSGGEPEVLYVGQDGVKAEMVLNEAPSAFTAVELYRNPSAIRRRKIVPDSGTEEEPKVEKPAKEPKAPKPKKPSKAELKKAEKEAKEADAAAQESETETEDDKPEF